MEDLTPHEKRLVEEIASTWPLWMCEAGEPLMNAAIIAHKHHVSLRHFLQFAEGSYRGCDPMDLPPKREDEE